MRIAVACLDPGIPLDGTKGAAVHLRSLVRALHARGHRISVFAVRGGAIPGADGVTLVADGGEPARAAILAKNAADPAAPFDAVYERLALFATGASRAARELAIPHVLEVNAPLADEASLWRGLGDKAVAAKEAEAAVIASADAVLPVSTALARHAVRLGAASGRVRVVPNAVDPALFSPAPRAPRRAGEPFTVGFVGSLKPWHGLDLLARTLELAARAGLAHWRARVVGDGPGRESLELRLASFGFGPERAAFTGAVPHESVPKEMALFDAAVVPYEDLPGFYFSPLKLYEALASGVPVVATDSGDVADALDGGRLGSLVPPGNANALFEALRAIDLDPAGAAARAREAGARVRAERSWDRNAETVESVILALGARAGS